jgi:hypothetical protein
MEDYEASLAQGSVLFSDSVDWEVHAGPVTVTADIPSHVEMLRAGTVSEQLVAARVLTILSSEGLGGDPDVRGARTEIVAAGGHDALLRFLAEDIDTEETTASLAKEAATAALANLTAQDDSRALVASAEGIPTLVSLITGWSRGAKLSEETMMYACGALGNLARGNPVCQSEIAAAGGIEALVALARAAGIHEEVDGAVAEPKEKSNGKEDEEEDEDTGLELNASIALRKLAIGHAENYAAMRELLSETDLRYFLHGEMPAET